MMNILANPSADQVFQSMSDSMSVAVNPLHVIGVIALLVGVVAALAFAARRRDPRQKPKAINNPARLLRDVARQAGLKPAELKQLKQLAAEQGISNPLVLLLCPSVLKKAVEARQTARAGARK